MALVESLSTKLGRMTADQVSPAASIIMLRHDAGAARVLMGQRGAQAAFMPSKFVFPGGRVDAADHSAPDLGLLQAACRQALQQRPREVAPPSPHVLAAAALRELDEETGLTLARAQPAALRFVFRAITPPGRSRRFDARFFLADAKDFAGDFDGFSAASGELSALQWVPLIETRSFDLPFITKVILAEIAGGLTISGRFEPRSAGVPFFDNSTQTPAFVRL